jgi:predicted nucleic acid-binding protein
MILVDTNVLVDVIEDDPSWADWSQRQLEAAAALDALAINGVIYAELSVGYRRVDDLDAMIAAAEITLMPIPRPALFLAGKAFFRYRHAGGTKTGVLPDFFIGAHAVIEDAPLITRDASRYRSYFPGITLITPG